LKKTGRFLGGGCLAFRKIEATIEQHPSAANAKKEWGILFWVVLLMNTAASQAQGLEGSRFPRWQLYWFAAGGSRKLPSVFASIQRLAPIVPIKSATSATMVHLGSLSGAACCHPIELPP